MWPYRLMNITELNPPPTEQICQQFNELRSDIVLHYELRSALSTCDYELQSLRHQYEALAPGKVTSSKINNYCFQFFLIRRNCTLSWLSFSLLFFSDPDNTTSSITKNRTRSKSRHNRRCWIAEYAKCKSLKALITYAL